MSSRPLEAALADRQGVDLSPGDPVYFHHPETVMRATVLRVLGDNRYTIQLDPRRPIVETSELSPLSIAIFDQRDALYREMRRAGIKVQQPFDVDGSDLEYNFEREEDEGA